MNCTYDVEVLDSFVGPDGLGFLDNMIGHTETDEFSILDVLGNLGVKTTSHSIIVCVLNKGNLRIDFNLPALPGKITKKLCTLFCLSDQKEF